VDSPDSTQLRTSKTHKVFDRDDLVSLKSDMHEALLKIGAAIPSDGYNVFVSRSALQAAERAIHLITSLPGRQQGPHSLPLIVPGRPAYFGYLGITCQTLQFFCVVTFSCSDCLEHKALSRIAWLRPLAACAQQQYE
jgi:hypothetical protein